MKMQCAKPRLATLALLFAISCLGHMGGDSASRPAQVGSNEIGAFSVSVKETP
jgi:hypothetical protein